MKNILIIIGAAIFLLQCTVLDFVPDNTATTPSNDATEEPPITRVAVPVTTDVPATPTIEAINILGKNLFNYGAQINWTNSDVAKEMDLLTRLGFKWAKLQLRWCDISTGKTNAELSQIGKAIEAANARGIKVMLTIVCAPKWSRADGGVKGAGP
ncbi:MAG: hypothetical protein HY257_01920, partial [Chloroflexi bacterium]|nr:hypothetical protein [Chloroflexota bacterium]